MTILKGLAEHYHWF